jgi:uncharacterized protein YjbJ (UPF0337 family)
MANKEELEKRKRQLVGQMRLQWNKLTDDDMTQIAGDVERLDGKLQERYGITREQAEREIHDWLMKASEK